MNLSRALFVYSATIGIRFFLIWLIKQKKWIKRDHIIWEFTDSDAACSFYFLKWFLSCILFEKNVKLIFYLDLLIVMICYVKN